ncbi:hypothetical protein [Gynuella sunshinyii]|uniref:Uncharacterized protein n=1 Tax=Gynuella sunshinyii YC6258 TaxID=1445510 RepID=A0A0C5V5S9_9GAMM|nr:hypothetical protein [Gynuella sunshinyii]AJQ94785.1 hypothetical Protein YC6258_02747 [Gynuella sunshinyii YC6258]
MDETRDSLNQVVKIGDIIEVLEIDSRLLEYLTDEDKASLNSFVGDRLPVTKINSDGSMVVSKQRAYENIIDGHDVAIYPKGAKRVPTER